MPLFVSKSTPVEAVQFDEGCTHPHLKYDKIMWLGEVRGEIPHIRGRRICKGEWIVSDAFGRVFVCSDEEFRAKYTPEPTISISKVTFSIKAIAEVCHEANLGICAATGDPSQKRWSQAEQWQRDSAIKGVQFALANPNAPPSAQHDEWSAEKERDGWIYGEVKDPVAKTHPCLVPYEALSAEQRAKDIVFKAIVNALKDL